MSEKELRNILAIQEVQEAIGWFQKSIIETKLKDKNRDLSKLEKQVENLISFSSRFMEISEENKIITRMFEEAKYRLVICDNEFRRVSKELETLKQNIDDSRI